MKEVSSKEVKSVEVSNLEKKDWAQPTITSLDSNDIQGKVVVGAETTTLSLSGS